VPQQVELLERWEVEYQEEEEEDDTWGDMERKEDMRLDEDSMALLVDHWDEENRPDLVGLHEVVVVA